MFKESTLTIESRELLMSKLISEKDIIKEFISNELCKRGFHAKIETFDIVKDRIQFETENFQTTPVIFKEINIGNFGGGIGRGTLYTITGKGEVVTDDVLNVWIPVHVSYTHFDGGTNGSNLFQVNVYVDKWGVNTHNMKIK